MIDQYWQTFIYPGSQLGIATRAEDRGSAGVRVDAGKVCRRQRKTTLGVVEFGHTVQKKGASRVTGYRRGTCDKHTEFERGMNIGKEDLFVLEIVECFQSSFCRDALKEAGSCLFGGNAGGGEQSDHALWLDEGHRAFDKQ